LCGLRVGSNQVSRAAAELDEMPEAWRTQELEIYRYNVLDAEYEKVRQASQVLDAAVLIACGVDDDGHRDILGCSVSSSEAEVHWRTFLSELKGRWLCGVELIVSDAHEGLQAARRYRHDLLFAVLGHGGLSVASCFKKIFITGKNGGPCRT